MHPPTAVMACSSFGIKLLKVSNVVACHKASSSHKSKKKEKALKKSASNFTAKNSDILENEILFGRSVCNIALRASRRAVFRLHLLKSWEVSEPTDPKVLETVTLSTERKIPIVYSGRDSLDVLAAHRPHQGVCLEVGELPFIDFDETCCEKALRNMTEVELSRPPLWVLLYGILDPMNMGAVLRSCFYFGVDKVLVAGNCSPMTPIVSKASSGAAEILQIHSTNVPTGVIEVLSQRNWEVIGTVVDSSESCESVEDITDFQSGKPLLAVFGSEGFGLPLEMLNLCTRHVTIQPPAETGLDHSLTQLVGSLNVSTAAAIIIHRLQRQRII